MVSLVIRDKSLSDRDDGIVVNIFRRQSEALPIVKNKVMDEIVWMMLIIIDISDMMSCDALSYDV